MHMQIPKTIHNAEIRISSFGKLAMFPNKSTKKAQRIKTLSACTGAPTCTFLVNHITPICDLYLTFVVSHYAKCEDVVTRTFQQQQIGLEKF